VPYRFSTILTEPFIYPLYQETPPMINPRTLPRLLAPVCLAVTLSLSAAYNPAMANPGDVNSINNGQTVAGGTYYNTAGDKTTFTNTAGTGLFVGPSTTVIGREVSDAVNPAASLTGNGGWLHFSAPGQVVRIDGKIDANAAMSSGAFIGNGGKVTVDSAYLYQNGQIYANGVNGGHVQFNVGALTMGPNAAIYAQGQGGNGGIVELGTSTSKGAFDIQQGAIVDVSGKVIGNYDSNLIVIQGGLINLEGLLMANGIKAPSGGDGGAVVLLAYGKSTTLNNDTLSNSTFMSGLQSNLVARDASLKQGYDGWVRLGTDAKVMTNGAEGLTSDDGGYGGLIAIGARVGIENNGNLQSNGGKGGDATDSIGGIATISSQDPALSELGQIDTEEGPSTYTYQESVGYYGGNGGNGGLVELLYGKTFENNGTISVLGGDGGHGGNAIATNPDAQLHFAYGGYGGFGGDGGNIHFFAASPIQDPGHLHYDGGHGGVGGTAIGNPVAVPGPASADGLSGNYSFSETGRCLSDCASNGGPIVPAQNPYPLTGNIPASPGPTLNGLFQSNRPVFNDALANQQPPKILLSLGQSNMFLTKTYSSITQTILTRAMQEYTNLMALGYPAAQAKQEAESFLTRSGVTSDVAQALLLRISTNRLQAEDTVIQMLKNLAEMTKTSALPQTP
jgi:hypothetical protein